MGLGGSTAFFACLVGLVVGKGILLGLAYSTYVGQSRAGVIPRGGERGGRGKEELGGVVHLATYLPVRLLLAGIMGCRWFLILRRVGERWRRVRSTFLFLCSLLSHHHHITFRLEGGQGIERTTQSDIPRWTGLDWTVLFVLSFRSRALFRVSPAPLPSS